MAATLIVVRLVPSIPTDGQHFRAALNTLSITAWDRSVNNFSPNAPNTTPDPITGGLRDFRLGEASALADAGVDLIISSATPGAPSFDKNIIQHYAIDGNGLPLVDSNGNVIYYAMATAIVVVSLPAGYQEYPTATSFDVRFQLTRNGIAIPDQAIEYNIVVTSAMPPASTAQLTWFQHIVLDPGPPPVISVDYVVPTSSLLSLPPAPVGTLPPNAGYINLGNAGQPPDFKELVKAIDAVLTLDSPSTAPQLQTLTEPLTIAQCIEIAAEIIYNRVVSPPPEPAGGLEILYTTPLNQDKSGGPGDQTWDNVRQTFEGNVQAYRSKNDSAASKLAGYVFAASAAAWAEYQTYHATAVLTPQQARITVLLDPALNNPPITPTPTVDIVLTSSDPSQPLLGTLSPNFIVPAAYFYALGAKNPPQMTAEQRYKAVVTTAADSLAQTLQSAIDSGFLSDGEVPLATTVSTVSVAMAQAVRRMSALSAGFITGTDPQMQISAIPNIIGRWLLNNVSTANFTVDFWSSEIKNHSADYLLLLLHVITGSNPSFVTYLQALPIAADTDLLKLTNGDWNTIFSAHSDWLPPFTLPGSTAQRTSAYIAYLRKLFTVGFTHTTGNPTTTGPSTLTSGPPADALWKFISNYPGFSFGPSLDPTTFGPTLTAQFPNDLEAQNWVAGAVTAINNLFVLTSGLSIGQGLQFSFMEALYARGFTSPEAVKLLTLPQFQYALSGTIAYNSAAEIWNGASGPGGNPGSGPGDGFQPVNGGDLSNCTPPDYLSPFGPIEYLHEVLKLTSGSAVLGDAVSSRRGPLGGLLATEANLKLLVPCIDLVLESLEAVGDATKAPGAVNNVETPVSEKLLCAVPQNSSPSMNAHAGVYSTLKTCFTSPSLPYNQPLDINRNYLRFLGTTRFETMRCFRRCITELPQGASLQPASFQSHLWRYPVTFDLALEYLCISKDEYSSFFSGEFQTLAYPTLYGLPSSASSTDDWIETACSVFGFLKGTGLTYCELVELAECGFIPICTFQNDRDMPLPKCLPCCLTSIYIQFPGQPIDQYPALLFQIMYFVRLWRKVNSSSHDRISFATLADICNVLGLLHSGSVSLDFIRQLASLLMLIEYLHLPWGHTHSTAVGAARTRILGLWADSTCPESYSWAIDMVLHAVETHSQNSFHCCRREAEFVKVLKRNLNSLAALAGFTAASPWNLAPTSTIRFVEVIAKIYASDFTVGEILFLFTTRPHLDGDDPFPMPSNLESIDAPLDLPDDNAWGLWALRRKLLSVDPGEEDCKSWTWRRIEATILEMGFSKAHTSGTGAQSLTQLAEHFFPDMLEQIGHPVPSQNKRWSTPLPIHQTTAHLWSSEPCYPFHYDPNSNSHDSEFAGELVVRLPLKNRDIARKLRDCRQLNDSEARAVQNLYFGPRVMLTPFSLIFSNFGQAVNYLIQEADETKRFEYFQRQFAIFYRRCKIISKHLAEHVSHVSCREIEEHHATEVSWRILLSLIADENLADSPWESDSGKPPKSFQWDPHFSGGSFAGLLGLVGTGLFGRYTSQSGTHWSEMRGPLRAFGHEEDEWDTPIPTLIPSLSPNSVAQSVLPRFKNGFILKDAYGEAISGAESFKVEWNGLIIIEEGGHYDFSADHVKHKDHHSDNRHEHYRAQHWLITLARGQKTWTLLKHNMQGEAAPQFNSHMVHLSRGVYHMKIAFEQDVPTQNVEDDSDCEEREPRERNSHHHDEETGFQLKYRGPDTHSEDKIVPFWSLIRNWKTGGLAPRSVEKEEACASISVTNGAFAFLSLQYVSTMRDVRRTYQRAFKAVLFAQRFCLSARRIECDWQSELGFMLDHPHHFEGFAYYLPQGASTYQTHNAYFDFNFLPVSDIYGPKQNPKPDQRAHPSLQRQTAMFDWWERIFDYTILRKSVHNLCGKEAWLLFEEVATQKPPLVQSSLGHIGVRLEDAGPLTTYFATAWFNLAWNDLLDERWAIRVWHADSWMKAVQKKVFSDSYSTMHPAWWVADDTNAVVVGVSGNQDLVSFVQNALLHSKDILPSYDTLTNLNDSLRERARQALLDYLCGMSRVPLSFIGPNYFATTPGDLSDLLLQDVTVGPCKRSSRIDDAIYAVQTFVQRVRLGLETSDWTSTQEFSSLWSSRFCTFETWRAWKSRQAYGEKWLAWDEIEQLKKTESFSFLLEDLRQKVSTIVEPGHPLWWPKTGEIPESYTLIQEKELATLSLRPNSDASPPVASYEGLRLIGQPWKDGRPTLLAPAPYPSSEATSDPRDRRGPGGSSPLTTPISTTASKAESASAKPGSAHPLQSLSITTSFGFESLDVIPLWISSAIRLGARFIRVAAGGPPPGVPFKTQNPDSTSCCKQCGKEHDDVVDEYYFWLQDSRYYDSNDAGSSTSAPSAFPSLLPAAPQSGSGSGGTSDGNSASEYVQDATIGASSAVDPSTDWEIPANLPALLAWSDRPMVHLFWTRVHYKKLDPPRWSSEGLPIELQSTSLPDLTFSGRNLDSLYFMVNNSAFGLPPLTVPAGFRYDLATDSAVIDPGTLPVFSQSPIIPPGLNCFPNFAFFKPGKPLFPLSTFGTAMAIADMLLTDCSFECALQWFRSVYDPTARDNTWEQCPKSVEKKSVTIVKDRVQSAQKAAATDLKQLQPSRLGFRDVPCCTCGPVQGEIARSRAVLLGYLQTLLKWGDVLMARNSLESFQHASVIFGNMKRILGPTPLNIEAHDDINPPMKVSNFIASPAPLNPELIQLYDEVTDRSALIHDSLNKRRLHASDSIQDRGLWGSHRRWDKEFNEAACEREIDCWSCCQPYRYTTLTAKAQEWTQLLKSQGGSLLAAYEKGDNEYISAMHATQDRQMLDLGLDVAQQQWRAADWDVQALDQVMDSALCKLRYFQGLIAGGLNAGESGFLIATSTSMGSRAASQIVEGVAQDIVQVPDTYIGSAGVYGTPVNIELIVGGTKEAKSSSSGARILNAIADATNTLAGVSSTEAGWSRRSADWKFQVDLITIEIQQIKRQQLAAWRRRHIALRELNNHQQRTEHSTQVQNFLRDRFTKQELYLFLQQETAAQYREMYEIVMKVARQAQEAFWYERADTRKDFLSGVQWQSLREGLLVGEQIDLALRSMEHEYMDLNCRDYEITKSFSLRLHFPQAFLLLKTTGYCELELPEWMFDLDYPGHYLRRIRNIAVSVPVVAGPYTGIHCRMQLLSSRIRYKPLLREPKIACCDKKVEDCHCDEDDPYVITRYSGTEAIATSDGLDDDGLFELNFRDERYLPFEFSGAVSRWRIELPPANNEFDFDSLSDFIIKLNYTAREGGDQLRRKASECAQKHLPGNGVRYFDIRHEFQDSWGVFQRPACDFTPHQHRDFEVRLSRNMFPFLTGCRKLLVKCMHLFIEKDCYDAEELCKRQDGDHIRATFIPHRAGRGRHDGNGAVAGGGPREFVLRNSSDCLELYHGHFDLGLAPIVGYVPELLGKLRLPSGLEDVKGAYLLCEYIIKETTGSRGKVLEAMSREGSSWH